MVTASSAPSSAAFFPGLSIDSNSLRRHDRLPGEYRRTTFPFYEIVFALVISCTLYLILDIEYPRFGLVRLDTTNLLLLDLANSMQYTQTN